MLPMHIHSHTQPNLRLGVISIGILQGSYLCSNNKQSMALEWRGSGIEILILSTVWSDPQHMIFLSLWASHFLIIKTSMIPTNLTKLREDSVLCRAPILMCSMQQAPSNSYQPTWTLYIAESERTDPGWMQRIPLWVLTLGWCSLAEKQGLSQTLQGQKRKQQWSLKAWLQGRLLSNASD